MKNNIIIYIFLAFLIWSGQPSFAQKNNEEEPQDVEEVTSADEGYNDYADTILKRNSISYQKDSLLQMKSSREFFYMRYLDSLLRKRTDIRSDTMSFDKETRKVKRKKISDYSGINQILNSFPVKIFFWLLAIFFISFVFYKLFFRRGIFDSFKNKRNSSDVQDEMPAGLEDSSVYDQLIHAAESDNNFNLATRYLYLKTLKMLSDKGFIDFAAEKTNEKYLREMESNRYQKGFEFLTRSYEYVWYGKFELNQFQYQKLKLAFTDFNKNIVA